MQFYRKVRNYQLQTTERYVIDSPWFWRKELHPRFHDLFQSVDFVGVVGEVNKIISFPFSDSSVELFGNKLYTYFSGFRFCAIPHKNPESPNQFLSALFFTLHDVLPQMATNYYTLDEDGLKDHIENMETGKVDTTKLTAKDSAIENNTERTELDESDTSTMSQQNTTTIDNTLEGTEYNSTVTNDTYLSPQNMGVNPTTNNKKGQGVEGLTNDFGNPQFSTSKGVQATGDSTVNNSNSLSSGQQSDNTIGQDRSSKLIGETSGTLSADNSVELDAQKSDKMSSTKDFSLVSKLLNLNDLLSNRLWDEILAQLNGWILSYDIATSDSKYFDCPIYK